MLLAMIRTKKRNEHQDEEETLNVEYEGLMISDSAAGEVRQQQVASRLRPPDFKHRWRVEVTQLDAG